MKKKKIRKFWAGFCDNKISSTTELYSEDIVLAIYLRRKDARDNYQDVRSVEIKEIK